MIFIKVFILNIHHASFDLLEWFTCLKYLTCFHIKTVNYNLFTARHVTYDNFLPCLTFLNFLFVTKQTE